MPSHILLLLGISRAVNASRALLRRVFPLMHPITLSSAGPCHNYIEFTLLLHMPLAGHSRFPTLPPSLNEGLLEPRRTCTEGKRGRGSRVVWDNGPNPLYLQIGSGVFQKIFADFLIVLR